MRPESDASRFARFFEQSTGLFAMVGADGFITDANPALCRLFDEPAEALRGRPFASLIADVERPPSAAHPCRVGRFDAPFSRRDGTTVWVQWSVNRDEASGSYCCAGHDVTARRAAEQDLAESRALLEEAQRLSRVGHYEFGPGRPKLRCSAELYRIFGIEQGPEPLHLSSLAERIHPDDQPHVLDAITRALLEGTSFETRHRVLLPGGETKHVLAIGAATLDGDRLVKFLGTVKDVSNEAEAQEELVRAKEAALVASEAKSQFLANMSHEIRTPLNGMLGMTALALDTQITDEQREYLEAAYTSGKVLLDLLNDILDLSKIESGRLEIEHVPFSLRDEIEESMRSLAVRAGEKKIELIPDVDPHLAERVLGDPTRFRQVVLNLLSNAIKFTEGGEVIVRASPSRDHSDTLVVSVEDTGVGIARDRLSRIFDPFIQGDGSTTRKYGGTGLGLSISRQLVGLMGGAIHVESNEGKGSRFWFTIKAPPARSASTPLLPLVPEFIEQRVLIVDDSRAARASLLTMLGALHVAAEAVGSPEEALALLADEHDRGRPFTIVFVDHGWPSLDGISFLKSLGQHPSHASLTRVLLPSTRRPTTEQMREVQVRHALSKPIAQRDLHALVTDIAAPRQARKRSVPAPVSPSTQRKLHVLVAEDNPVNARLATRLLGKMGHQVTLVSTGQAAVEAVRQDTFDIVLMDVQMPEKDGLEATREIRASEQGRSRRLPIIALTANAMKGDEERCVDAGMDGYLDKPVDPAKLQATIERYTSGGAPTGTIPPPPMAPGLDHNTFRVIGRTYLETYEPMLARIGRAIDRADRTEIEMAAHAAKGALAFLGADDAIRTARALETSAPFASMAECARFLIELRQHMERLASHLEETLNASSKRF